MSSVNYSWLTDYNCLPTAYNLACKPGNKHRAQLIGKKSQIERRDWVASCYKQP